MASGRFKPATRTTAKAMIFIFGPTGHGKSASALLMAKGLTRDQRYDRILMVDTEHGRGTACVRKKFGDEVVGNFYAERMNPPFSVEKLISIVYDAEKDPGIEVVIIDSISHFWAGQGGLLEQKEEVSKTNKNPDRRSDWQPITKSYNNLIEVLLQSRLHVIVTSRSKSGWDYAADKEGKLKPVIIGLAPVMRDGFQFEFSQIIYMAEKATAIVLKDDTNLLPDPDTPFTPTVDTGKIIRDWYHENIDVAKAEGTYGIKSEEFRKCKVRGCDGLCKSENELEEVGDYTVKIFRCTKNPAHVIRERVEAT